MSDRNTPAIYLENINGEGAVSRDWTRTGLPRGYAKLVIGGPHGSGESISLDREALTLLHRTIGDVLEMTR